MQNLINVIELVESYNKDELENGIKNVVNKGALSLLILCCDTSEDLTQLNTILPTFTLPVFGGIFPEVLWQDKTIHYGVLIVGLNSRANIQINHNVSNKINCSPDIDISNSDSMFVFIDGLASQIELCIQSLYDWVGNECKVFGGGAGSLSFEQKPCIITNQGILADAMIVAALPITLDVAIAHGWQNLAGPFLATKVVKNRVKEINFQPAFDVFKQQIFNQTNIRIDSSNFTEYASYFPLGIDRLDDEMLVRDPIKIEGSDIICVGAIPENSMLYILTGETESLVSATQQAIKKDELTTDTVFVVDCVSRKLFLKNEFELELQAIKNEVKPFNNFIGVLALGEISTGKFGAINFHNKTSIIANLTLRDDSGTYYQHT